MPLKESTARSGFFGRKNFLPQNDIGEVVVPLSLSANLYRYTPLTGFHQFGRYDKMEHIGCCHTERAKANRVYLCG